MSARRPGDLHAREDLRPAVWGERAGEDREGDELVEDRVDGSTSTPLVEQLATSIAEAVRTAGAGVPRLAFKPEEAATALGVSRNYFDEHIGPELRWVRRGRLKLVAVTELTRWLEREGERTLDRRGKSAG